MNKYFQIVFQIEYCYLQWFLGVGAAGGAALGGAAGKS